MFLVIVVLFFFVINWITSYLLVIVPIHLLRDLGHLGELLFFIAILLIFSWFFGD